MKKESKAKSVIIAVIAIILALCAVGAVVGVGSSGYVPCVTFNGRFYRNTHR